MVQELIRRAKRWRNLSLIRLDGVASVAPMFDLPAESPIGKRTPAAKIQGGP